MRPLSPKQFATDLLHLYEVASRARLEPQYLKQVIAAFTEIYINDFTAAEQPNAAYKLFLRTCLDGLTGLTSSIDRRYLEGGQVDALLHVASGAPPAATGLTSLARPFVKRAPKLQKLGVLAYASDGHMRGPPNQDLYERKSDYRDALRTYEKDREQYYGSLTPAQTAFLGSPLFRYAHKFAPPDVPAPLSIEEKLWFEGMWIVGSTGRGKTNLLRHLVLNRLDKGSVIILDPKGDLLRSFSRMAEIQDRLVVIEPSLTHPPAINPLDIGGNSVEFLSYLFELLDTKMTPNQDTLFRAVLTLCLETNAPSIAQFREVLNGGWRNYPDALSRLQEEDRRFFEQEATDRVYMDRKPEVLARLRRLLQNKYLRAMFNADKTRVDFGRWMDERKVILINNSYDPDVLDEAGAEFLGRIVIAMVWAAARRRAHIPNDQKTPVYLFIDEAHYVIARDKTIKKILNQCRSQNISMIFANQEVGDISDPDVLAALKDRPVIFGSTRKISPELDKIVHAPEDGFSAKQAKYHFACFIAEQMVEAVSVAVPHVRARPDHTLEDHPLMSPSEQGRVMDRVHRETCIRPGEINEASVPREPAPAPKPQEGDLPTGPQPF